MSNTAKTNPEALLAAIRYYYDNTEGISPEVLLAYWTALTHAADDDEPRKAFETLHAAMPFTASTSFSLDLSGYEVFRMTEALAASIVCLAVTPTLTGSVTNLYALQLLNEAQADLEGLCEENDLDEGAPARLTIARIDKFLRAQQVHAPRKSIGNLKHEE